MEYSERDRGLPSILFTSFPAKVRFLCDEATVLISITHDPRKLRMTGFIPHTSLKGLKKWHTIEYSLLKK